ncbi:hypothetical protein HMI51_30160 [Corallococcus coralloides]|nr:hypothetical protein [Corallococcus coralloides]
MGWLEERVHEIEGEAVTLTELARRLRKAPNWPVKVKLRDTSLGTNLKKFDQGKDLHLLDKNPALREFLSSYLKFSSDEFEEKLAELKAPRERRFLRFELWDAGIRPLDLREEPLPPAFPPEVLDPKSWPVLWLSPSGSARTLVGEWLAAQMDVVFIKAEHWADAERRLPPGKGKVFIALKSPVGMPVLQELPSRLSICVAVDGVKERQARSSRVFGEPPVKQAAPASERTWPLVKAPPVERWLKALVAWIWERRRSDVDFDTLECFEWLQKEVLPRSLIDGFGSAVGFVGLYATYRNLLPKEKGSLRDESWLKLSRSFIRTRLSHLRSERQAPDFEALWSYLQRLAQGMLMHGVQSWEQARSIEEWQDLVPVGPASGAIEWLSQPAVSQSLKVDARAIQKVAEAHPPDTFLMVRALQDLRLLREQHLGQFVLRPRWVFAMLLKDAARSLLDGPAATWGQALLHPHSAYPLITQLLSRCRAGDFVPIQRLLVQREPSSPQWVASVEASFVALGWTLLEGGKVPSPLAKDVFERQQRLVVRHHQIPLPSLGYGYEAWHPMLKPGAWLLAAHALSEQQHSPPRQDDLLLNPWRGRGEPQVMDQMLTLVQDVASDEAIESETRLHILGLYGRMLRRVGPVAHRDEPAHDLQMPEFLSESARKGTLTWSYFKGYRDFRELFMPLMRRYLEQQGASWEVFARALWRAWLDSEEWLEGKRKTELPAWSLDWYAFIPPEAFLNKRLKHVLENNALPFERFTDEQWDAFLAYMKRGVDRPSFHDPEPWRHMPARFIRRVIAEELVEPHQGRALQRLWEVATPTVRQELGRLIEQGKWRPVLLLAWEAPAEETEAIIHMVSEPSMQPGAPRQDVIHWLHDRIRKRVQGWEHGWALLQRLNEPLP